MADMNTSIQMPTTYYINHQSVREKYLSPVRVSNYVHDMKCTFYGGTLP